MIAALSTPVWACGKSPQPPASSPPQASVSTPTQTPTPTEAPVQPSRPAEAVVEAAAAPTDIPTQPPAEVAQVEPPQAQGTIKLVHIAPKSKAMRELAANLAESRLFNTIIDELNKGLTLPRDLTIKFEDCGEINAFYSPEHQLIQMCWELLEYTVEQFAKDAKSDEEAAEGFLNATIFTLFHELGHALVHLLDLPITGKEEDVVDQLATWFIVEDGGEQGALMAVDGALSFLTEESDEGEPNVWGVHSLDQQRFFNIVCWVYGSNPEAYAELTASKGGPLPDDRADSCPDEWGRMSSAWNRLLADHVKTSE